MQATTTLTIDNVAFSDSVFTVNESSKDYHVTFVERFSISIRNATDYTFRVTQSLVIFEINIYPNFTETMNKSYSCVSIQMLASEQESIRLIVFFSIKNRHGS
jgi:hypothetical protein